MFDISIDKRTNVLYNHKYKQMFWFWIKEEFTMKMKKSMLKKRFATLFFLIVMAFALVFIFGSTKASADSRHRENDRKFFTSYVVESQDTLWGIAWQYITPEYDSMDEYIHEILCTNQLDSTRIYPGQLILIPYYADAPMY